MVWFLYAYDPVSRQTSGRALAASGCFDRNKRYFSNNCEIQKSASINIIVTILFFLICWTPFQYSLGQGKTLNCMDSKKYHDVSPIEVTRKNADWKNGIPIVTLVYVNSALNPFLYSLLTNNFRQEFLISVSFLETMNFFRIKTT